MTGRLTADGPVTVNGNKAYTGDTIFPGTLLETPDGVGATVQLGSLGQLDLSAGTRLTLSFGEGSVRGALLKGCAILNASPGIEGVLTLPRGVTKRTTTGSTAINACADGNGSELPTTGAKSARRGNSAINLGGASVSWLELSSLLAGSGALTAGFRVAGTSNVAGVTDLCCCCCCCCCNPSPSAPLQ